MEIFHPNFFAVTQFFMYRNIVPTLTYKKKENQIRMWWSVKQNFGTQNSNFIALDLPFQSSWLEFFFSKDFQEETLLGEGQIWNIKIGWQNRPVTADSFSLQTNYFAKSQKLHQTFIHFLIEQIYSYIFHFTEILFFKSIIKIHEI